MTDAMLVGFFTFLGVLVVNIPAIVIAVRGQRTLEVKADKLEAKTDHLTVLTNSNYSQLKAENGQMQLRIDQLISDASAVQQVAIAKAEERAAAAEAGAIEVASGVIQTEIVNPKPIDVIDRGTPARAKTKSTKKR